MEQVSPTRTELLQKRSRIDFAQQGAELLRSKREALVREFLEEVKSFRSEREEMLKSLNEATRMLMRTLAIDSPQQVRSVGLTTRNAIGVDVEEQNIWGTRVVDVESHVSPESRDGQGFAPVTVTTRIEETKDRFDDAVEYILKVAPKFHKLGRLAEEIRKTSRRVNALEQRLIPSLEEQVSYIRSVLDQREREDLFRMKRIKKKGGG